MLSLRNYKHSLDDAKSKILSDADIDVKAAARAELIATAKKIAPTAELAGLYPTLLSENRSSYPPG